MNIVIIAGSNHHASSSTRLARYISTILQNQQHHVKLFDLYRSPLPFFSPSEAYNEHASLNQLKKWMSGADAVVLATPEYHGSLSGVLKNALDHIGQEHFKGKPVLSVSSAGGAVGVSSLQQMQQIVRNLHGINCPEWISIGGAQRKSFQSADSVIDSESDTSKRIQRATDSFVQLAQLVRQNSITA